MPSGSGDTPQQGAMPTNGQGGKAVVPNEVRQYEPILRGYLKEKNLESYTEILLGLTMQESGGRLVDVMQSSESIDLLQTPYRTPIQVLELSRTFFEDVEISAKQGYYRYSSCFTRI